MIVPKNSELCIPKSSSNKSEEQTIFSYTNSNSSHSIQNVDIEERIIQFLDMQGIEMKNPIEKYYEFCEKKRKSVILTSFSEIDGAEDCAETPENNKKLRLSCPLYTRRKKCQVETRFFVFH